MRENKISCRQMKRMIFVEGFGAAGLTFPAAAAMGSRSEGLVPMVGYLVMQVLFLCWILFLVRLLERKKPQMTDGYGFVLGKGLGVICLFRLFVNAWALFYFFGLSIQNIYMPGTSLLSIWLPFALLLWYCTQTTLQKRGRFLELLFPWIVALLLFLLFFAFWGVGDGWHMPKWEESPSVFWENSYRMLLCTTPLEFLFFLIPAVVKNLWKEEEMLSWKERKKAVWTAAAGVIICNGLLWLATVENLGGALTASSPWPVVKVMQLIHLPGGFLERLDILLVMFWIFCLVGVLSGYLYYGRKLGEEIFGAQCRDGKVLRKRTALLTGVVIVLLLFFSVTISGEKAEDIFGMFLLYKKWIDFPLLLLLPLLALLTSRKKITACLLLLFLPLSGCHHQEDVEEKNYVLSLYVEDGKEGYDYWISTADLSKMGNKEVQIPCTTIRFQAKDMEEMEKKYGKTVPGDLEWNHIETIFLGPELIKDKEKTHTFLREWEASWQKSPDVLLSVCLQDAGELLDIKNIPEGAAGQEVSRLMENREQENQAGRHTMCRTPMDVLKAEAEGRPVFVSQTKIRWNRLVVKDDFCLTFCEGGEESGGLLQAGDGIVPTIPE